MQILKYQSQSIYPGGRCGGIRVLRIWVLMITWNIKNWYTMSRSILDKHLSNDLSGMEPKKVFSLISYIAARNWLRVAFCVHHPPLQLGRGKNLHLTHWNLILHTKNKYLCSCLQLLKFLKWLIASILQ